jgi:hypothetical protein
MIKVNNQKINEIAQAYLNKIEIAEGLEFSDLLTINKERIILANPKQLVELSNKLCNFRDPVLKRFKKFMNSTYQKNINKHGHWLTTSLGINVCPYCNLNFTHTITKKSKKLRPEFDHFYPKSEYPLLALSFYNLIPCCPVCNHTKKVEVLEINPYSDDFKEAPFRIDYPLNTIFYGNNRKNKNESEKWRIKFLSNSIENKYIKNIQTFGLEDRYNEIKDYAEEIVFKAMKYNDGYFESIKQTFSQMSLSKSEMDRIIFGNYTNPEEFSKRPLSKLTHDLLKQFGVDL